MTDVILADRMVRVTFKKTVSDGNYGGETSEIQLEAPVENEDDEDTVAEGLMLEARRLVHAELARSPSANVRRAVGAERSAAPQHAAALAGDPYEAEDAWPR